VLRLIVSLFLALGLEISVAQTATPTVEITSLVPLHADLDRLLITYRNDGLRLSALMVKPTRAARPLPVLIANHGFHPDPPHYGFVGPQRNERPGKYYGGIPTAFARRGFAVIMADYRGHNTSEGHEFTRLSNAPDLYATDVLALLKILPIIEGLLTDCVFVWGHSMGAHVSLRTILAHESIRAVSLWSLASPVKDWSAILDHTRQLPPIAIRHSIKDSVAPVTNSRHLEAHLRRRGLSHETTFADSALHFFEGELFERVIEADSRFFAEQSHATQCQNND
jgi:pimeloyl-ACP methyl ester carboxylesterase